MRDDFKRLYRSRAEGRIAGLCAGLGLYLRADPVIVRLVWAAITLMTGVVPGVLAYLVGWFIVPLEPLPLAAERVQRTDGSPA